MDMTALTVAATAYTNKRFGSIPSKTATVQSLRMSVRSRGWEGAMKELLERLLKESTERWEELEYDEYFSGRKAAFKEVLQYLEGKTEEVTISVEDLYGKADGKSAMLEALPEYISKAVELAGNGNSVVLTGAGPIWLYLPVAHALHGKATKLEFNSPASGRVVVFDHTNK